MIAKVMQVLLALTLIALLTVACSHQLIADTAQESTEASSDPFATRLSDEAIRVAIIRHARAAYYGSCPCPDSIDRGGRRCGGRSAYSRPGGESPLCFAWDVSNELVSAQRAADARQAPIARP